MATLTADPADPEYNAHFTQAQFDERMLTVSFYEDTAAWNTLTSDQKDAAIIEAAQNTARQEWTGTRSAIIVNSRMVWPRSGLTYPSGDAVDDTQNPEELLNYEACWILGLLSEGGTTSSVVTGEIKSRKVGDLQMDYTTSADGTTSQTSMQYAPSCDSYLYGWKTSGKVAGISSALLTRT